tara:strand:- start:1012 stop:1392 length:381 start_codon:yes stop_codon:yes gene_type:complete
VLYGTFLWNKASYNITKFIMALMFELEYLVAFSLGAALVAITPVVSTVAGRESSVTRTISGVGRGLTKQGLKVGIVIGSTITGAFSGIKSGVNEIGESFGDILAEAKADLAEPSKTSKVKTVTVKS